MLKRFWNWTYIHRQKMYIIGAATLQGGAVFQIIKIYTTKSAEDFALMWMFCLLVGELLHLRLAFSASYWAWKLAHCFALVLIITLFIGVILYD